MLDIDLNPTFTRLAKFQIPFGDGFLEQHCHATFNALEISEFGEFDLSQPASVEAFLRRVVVSLDGLREAGETVAYAPAALERLLDRDWARRGLVDAYLRGRTAAAAGN